jgi:hypothetical protein
MYSGSRIVPDVQVKASSVSAEGGVVLMDGSGGVVLALTPEAAIETADLLYGAAADAQGQVVWAQREKREREARR